MKGSIFLLLAAVALSKGARLTWSDCLNKETVNILVPHENCHRYYQCDDGKLIPRICPSKLVFNVKDQRCDWPENVDCQNRDITEDSDEDEPEPGTGGGHNDPSEAPAICAQEESDSILIAHEYCNKYYICSNGGPIAMFCPHDLFFNADIDQCDYPKNVKCDREVAPQPQPEDSDEADDSDDVSEPEPVPKSDEDDDSDDVSEPQPELDNGDGPIGAGNNDPSAAPEICAAPDSEGILIAHEYCNKYYICSHGHPVAMRCGPDLFFNANTDQCDYPKNVVCDREIAPQPQPERSGEDDDSEDISELEPKSDEDDESDDVSEPQPELDNGDGDGDEPIGAGNNDPSAAPEICAAPDSEGILIAHEYCNKYYICNHGHPVAMLCGPDLFFNANTDQCDYPKNVECDREVAPQPEPEHSNEEDESDDVSEPEPVPESDEDDDSDDVSEPQPELDNGDGPIGAGNNDPSAAPEICAAPDSEGILIAHEYCNKYYICNHGHPVAMPCGPDLFFNANTDQCDYPKNVECDREVAPQPEPEHSDEEDESDDVSELEPVPESDEDDDSDDVSEPQPESDNGDGDDDGPIGAGNNDPSAAPEICAAPDSEGILIAHEYCNKYYICNHGHPVAMPCGPDLFFNANTDQCDYPKNVECDREVAPQPEPEHSDEEDESDDVSELEPVPESDEDDDSDDVSEPQPESDNGDGDDDGPIGAGNNDPSAAPEICAASDSDGILIAHEYCNKYYICSHGHPVAMPCGPDLFFNANTDQCDYPKNVECDREVAPQPEPEHSDEEDESDDVSELEPVPESDEDDDSDDVSEPQPESDNGDGDDDGPIGAGNNDPSAAPEICAAPDSEGILIAHEYCNKYYICNHGHPVAMPCGPDLFFNANTDQCDYPKNVKCDREVAPQPEPEHSDEEDESDDVSELEPVPESDEDDDSDDVSEPQPESDNGDGDDDGPIGAGNNDPSAAPEICAAPDSEGILIAHEYCNKYYICNHGHPVAMPCGPDLFFNANTDQCDYPKNVECDREVAPQPEPEHSDEDDESEDASEPVPESDEDDDSDDVSEPQPELDNGDGDDNGPVGAGNNDPSAAPEICAAPDSDGILIAHEYCNKYYICNHGNPVAMLCGPDLFFNANTDQCDYPKNVECDREVAPQPELEHSDEDDESDDVSEPEPEPESDEDDDSDDVSEPQPESDNGDGDDDGPIGAGNNDPSAAPEICAASDSDGILIAHEYCNKYYICSHGHPVAMPCGPDLFFNANTDQCDYPKNVECDREVAPQPQPDEDGDNDNEVGLPELEPQPEPEPESDNGGVEDNKPVAGGNNDPSQAPEICAAADSDGILVAHEYCNKFYICSNGQPVALPCHHDLFFNADKDQCDYPENVNCDREVAPLPQPDENVEDLETEPESDEDEDPIDAATVCAEKLSNGVLVAHENCHQFYICSDAEPVILTCPSGLFFNVYEQQCDYSDKVDCGKRRVFVKSF